MSTRELERRIAEVEAGLEKLRRDLLGQHGPAEIHERLDALSRDNAAAPRMVTGAGLGALPRIGSK
jgi:hypothetical protein